MGNNYSLKLIPYHKQEITIPLLQEEQREFTLNRMLNQSPSNYHVYSDLSYEFQIIAPNIKGIQNVSVYVNDCYEPSVYDNGHIVFLRQHNATPRIFLDCFGFVEICLSIKYSDNSEINLYTKHLPVLVKQGILNDSVRSMVDYVYNHQEFLLLNGETKPKDISNLKENGYKNLSAKILLAENIVKTYEISYGYFNANSRFHISKTPAIDYIEKLQYLSQETISYITQHPEQLQQVSSSVGVRIGTKVYHPKKTLIMQNVYSRDTYENRVIVDFLKTMIPEIKNLLSTTNDLIDQVPSIGESNDTHDYVYSSYYIFAETRKSLIGYISRLNKILQKLQGLLLNYERIMGVSASTLKKAPKPTAVFMSVPQYNKVFNQIHQWYRYGIYDFSGEKLILSFIKISTLYESYLLTKMIEFLNTKNFSLETTKNITYPIKKNWKHKNTPCNNTFIFKKDSCTITLYYQPVIFDYNSSNVNNIELYRNNTISLTNDSNEERQGHYYVPDFLIKVQSGETVRYVIFDAKFSSQSTVKSFQIPNLSYKYLFSISSINRSATVEGLCIIYGKCEDNDEMKTVYDKQISSQEISPFAEIIPMIENINPQNHTSNLNSIFNRVLSTIYQE